MLARTTEATYDDDAAARHVDADSGVGQTRKIDVPDLKWC